jgi:hypothetical protein
MRTGPRKTRDVLQRRLDYLEDRIGKAGAADLSWDKNERGALAAALRMVNRAIVPTEGTALVMRELEDGELQVLLVADGETIGEVRAVMTPHQQLQLITRGDVRVREDARAPAREAS